MDGNFLDNLSSSSNSTSKIAKFFQTFFSYVVMQEILDKKLNGKYSSFLFCIGKLSGKSIALSILSGKKKNTLSCFLEEMELIGFGKTQIKRLNLENNVCILSNPSNAIAKQRKRSFGISKPKDSFHCGIYSGVLSQIAKKEIMVKETECICSNSDYCIFSACSENNTDFDAEFYKDLSNLIDFESLKLESKQYIPNSLIEKIVRTGQIQLSQGEIKMWGVYCAFFPVDMYGIAFNYFSSKKMQVYPEMFYTGCIQSKIAILFQVKKFGIENGIKTFTSLMNQLEFFGVGKGEITINDANCISVKFKESLCLIQHKTIFKSDFRNAYLEGILAGMAAFAFEKKVCEIKIKEEGDDLVFNLSFGRKDMILDAKSKIKDEKIIEIIEEKMKHDYYLT